MTSSRHHQSDRLVLGRSPQDEPVEDLAAEGGWLRVDGKQLLNRTIGPSLRIAA